MKLRNLQLEYDALLLKTGKSDADWQRIEQIERIVAHPWGILLACPHPSKDRGQ